MANYFIEYIYSGSVNCEILEPNSSLQMTFEESTACFHCLLYSYFTLRINGTLSMQQSEIKRGEYMNAEEYWWLQHLVRSKLPDAFVYGTISNKLNLACHKLCLCIQKLWDVTLLAHLFRSLSFSKRNKMVGNRRFYLVRMRSRFWKVSNVVWHDRICVQNFSICLK